MKDGTRTTGPVSNRTVRKLRWSDPEPDDRSAPLDWRVPVLILATLFLNFPFWYLNNLYLCVPGPIWRSAANFLAAALVMIALFFVGPALASQAIGRPLLAVAENSFGSIPAFGVRLSVICFLVCWIAALANSVIHMILLRQPSFAESVLWAGGILVFAFVTGLQTPNVRAKLALFTNKLGIAILAAALFRVRDGLPFVLRGFRGYYPGSAISYELHGLAMLSFYVAPLSFLAADFGYRVRSRRQMVAITSMGLVLPLCGTLLLMAVIDVAINVSRLYQPSLDPNIAMALWSQVASSYLPGIVMLTAITVFGALRFGVGAISEAVPAEVGRVRWVILGTLIAAITWLSVQNWVSMWTASAPLEWSATSLAVASAVVSVDFATRGWRVEQTRRIDWVGTAALLAGSTAALYLPDWTVGTNQDQWHPWLLPSYGVGILVCLAGRAVEKVYLSRSGKVAQATSV